MASHLSRRRRRAGRTPTRPKIRQKKPKVWHSAGEWERSAKTLPRPLTGLCTVNHVKTPHFRGAPVTPTHDKAFHAHHRDSSWQEAESTSRNRRGGGKATPYSLCFFQTNKQNPQAQVSRRKRHLPDGGAAALTARAPRSLLPGPCRSPSLSPEALPGGGKGGRSAPLSAGTRAPAAGHTGSRPQPPRAIGALRQRPLRAPLIPRPRHVSPWSSPRHSR